MLICDVREKKKKKKKKKKNSRVHHISTDVERFVLNPFWNFVSKLFLSRKASI